MTTSTCASKVSDEDGPVGEFRTNSGWDDNAAAYSRAYAESALEACREARRIKRARTHQVIAKVPDRAMPVAAGLVSVLLTLLLLITWGASSAVALQLGAGLAVAYSAANDVRMSVVHKNPGWRERHRVISRMVRRHPLD